MTRFTLSNYSSSEWYPGCTCTRWDQWAQPQTVVERRGVQGSTEILNICSRDAHFIVGAKKIVFGPAGWFQIPLADCDMLVLNAADDQQTTLGEKYSSVLTSNSEWRKIIGRGSYDPLQASKSKQQARQSLFFRDYSSPESGICPLRCTKVSVNTYLRITHLSHISHLNNI